MTITQLRPWDQLLKSHGLNEWLNIDIVKRNQKLVTIALVFMLKVLHSQNLPKVPGYSLITGRLINSFWSSHASSPRHVMSVTRNLRHLNRPNRNRKKLSLSGLNVKKKRKKRGLKILKYKTFQLTTCKCVEKFSKVFWPSFDGLLQKRLLSSLLGESGEMRPVNLPPCRITRIGSLLLFTFAGT